MKRSAVIIVLLLLLSIGFLSAPFPVRASGQTRSLLVKTIVQSIPADGGTYGAVAVSLVDISGMPLISTTNLQVLLSSSNVGVATVHQNVTFREGLTFLIVNLTTTSTIGSTTISATSQGVQSGSSQVSTTRVGGYPTGIRVFAAPTSAVAQPSYHGVVLVELVDNRGNPAEGANETTITLSSSNPGVASTGHSTVVVAAGKSLATDSYNTGLAIGTATISATSPGLSSDSALVGVLGSTPTQLAVAASTNPADAFSNQTLAIWILDQFGNPTLAAADINVSISNSNTGVLSIRSSAQIHAGDSFVDVPFATLGASNLPAKVTVSSSNLASSFVNIIVSTPSSSPGTVSLGFNLAPPRLLANGRTATSVFAYLTKNSRPYEAGADTSVSLFSSDAAVVTLNQSVTIKAGHTFAVATVSTSYLVGNAQLTAQAQNVASAQSFVTTVGQSPSRLTLVASPAIIPANGGSYQALSLGLLSSGGLPANAPSDVRLRLVSSNPSVLPLNITVTIPGGQASILVSVTTTASPGVTTVTASGSGYSQASTSVTTVVPGASGLRLSAGPLPGLQTPGNPTSMLAVQLLDAGNSPVESDSPVPVTITGSNLTVFPKPLTITIPSRNNVLLIPLNITDTGTTQLTVTSPGLAPSSVMVKFLPYPLVATITANPDIISPHTSSNVTYTAIVQGSPLSGGPVTWSTDLGRVWSHTVKTNSFGSATVKFNSTVLGNANVTGSLKLRGLRPYVLVFTVSITPNGLPLNSGGGSGFDLNTLIAIVVGAIAVILAIVVVLTFMRRRNK